jgi:hypothetical protein
VELVTIGNATIGRAVLEPGRRWSTSVRPIARTESCEAPHFQYHVSVILRAIGAPADRRSDLRLGSEHGVQRSSIINRLKFTNPKNPTLNCIEYFGKVPNLFKPGSSKSMPPEPGLGQGIEGTSRRDRAGAPHGPIQASFKNIAGSLVVY